jgi:VanZ family protein
VAGGAPRLGLWGPVAAWMAVLFALSSRPLPASVSSVPDWITHGAGYAILGALLCRALAGGLARPVAGRLAVLAVVIATAYGVTDEVHQSFVPGRMSDAWDVLKDLGGASVAAAACAWPRGPRDEERRKAA